MFPSPVISLGIPNASERLSNSLYSLNNIRILSLGISVSFAEGIITPSSLAIKTMRQWGGSEIVARGRPTEGELSLRRTSRILNLPTEKCSNRVKAGLERICQIRCIAFCL